MKKFAISLLVILFSLSPLLAFSGCAGGNRYDTAKPSLEEKDGWKLAYSDDFSKFSSMEDVYANTAWHPVAHTPRHAGYWCDETVDFDAKEGAVVVRSFETDNHVCDVCPQAGIFTGGIETRHNFEQAFGYFEATVKVPVGHGMWSAFWLQCDGTKQVGSGGEDGTEIDIYESSFIRKNRTKTGNALHYDAYNAPWYHYGDHVTDVGYDLYDGEYHTYGLWWSPDYYVFYVDDNPVWATDYAGVSKVPEFMMLTVEIKGNELGPYGQRLGDFENRDDGGNDFYIKSVNVWQNDAYKPYIKAMSDYPDKTKDYTVMATICGLAGGAVILTASAITGIAIYKRKKGKALN